MSGENETSTVIDLCDNDDVYIRKGYDSDELYVRSVRYSCVYTYKHYHSDELYVHSVRYSCVYTYKHYDSEELYIRSVRYGCVYTYMYAHSEFYDDKLCVRSYSFGLYTIRSTETLRVQEVVQLTELCTWPVHHHDNRTQFKHLQFKFILLSDSLCF
jgi:hypothetical protein